MPLKSDLQLDASKFDPKSVSKQTHDFNNGLMDIMKGGPKWWEVGAEKYRRMRANGETPLPKPVVLDSGKDVKLPSRDADRQIPCRVFTPESGKSKGVYYHIHGGGWVLQNESSQDPMLKYLADHTHLTVVSVGYRLSPENPYPAPNHDCFDIAEYLVDNAEQEYGGPMLFMGGESAGGHLSAVTCFHLLESRPDFAFKAILLNYGCFDISGFQPNAWHFDLPLVLDVQIMQKFAEAYQPGTSQVDRRDPKISPLFANLAKLKCPPALFTCGTLDPLLDDSVMLATKWMMSGAEAVLKIYPGAPHGFTLFAPSVGTETVQQCLDDTVTFITEKC